MIKPPWPLRRRPAAASLILFLAARILAADPQATDAEAEAAWEAAYRARQQWWSFQPVQSHAPPEVDDPDWNAHPVDRFVRQAMAARGLSPAGLAEPRALIRRVSFTLTGLPPSPETVQSFLDNAGPDALHNAMGALLSRPEFGEHWARHWMDLMRFAESHGSEGDPAIPEAWRYRDYLIRAFNRDVPIDQLIREHVAGDLLEHPRWNLEEEFNESILGIAHLRLVEHGFQPVDTKDEQIKTVDSQIDVITKAFQGLTVSCARCHHHKFDPVSQQDYYALFGVLASSRPSMVTLDDPRRLRQHRDELQSIKTAIKREALAGWRAALDDLESALPRFDPSDPASLIAPPGDEPNAEIAGREASFPRSAQQAERRAAWTKALTSAASDKRHPLHRWVTLRSAAGADFDAAWKSLSPANRAASNTAAAVAWNFAETNDAAAWFYLGINPPEHAPAPGAFAVPPHGESFLAELLPPGAYSHLLSARHNGILQSPRFKIQSNFISVRALGADGARVRLIPDHYPIGQGAIFPQANLKGPTPEWVRLDTAYRKGAWAYLELAAAGDVTSRDRSPPPEDGRSHFGLTRVAFHDGKTAPEDERDSSQPVASLQPKDHAEFTRRLMALIRECLDAWETDQLTGARMMLLNDWIRAGLLPSTTNHWPAMTSLVAGYRRLESKIPKPRRAPGVWDAQAQDEPFLPRGDHLHPADPVPRGYLRWISHRRYGTDTRSGRGELARDLTRPDNPLTARVMVNRVWHQVFGVGLVPTVDNFGHLGEAPSHPELLDYLAGWFIEHDWSVKELLAFLMTSRTYRLASESPETSRTLDPDNRWLSRGRVRRLAAESIRDSLLAVSGRLEHRAYAPGSDALAAPDKQTRRSVYLTIRRNSLNPFLEAFDAPKPFSTLGRRDTTNVPAQSLALLNHPFVIDAAGHWAMALLASPGSDAERLDRMFEEALARPPADWERAACRDYLEAARARHDAEGDLSAWRDLAQSIFNLKEFIYLR